MESLVLDPDVLKVKIIVPSAAIIEEKPMELPPFDLWSSGVFVEVPPRYALHFFSAGAAVTVGGYEIDIGSLSPSNPEHVDSLTTFVRGQVEQSIWTESASLNVLDRFIELNGVERVDEFTVRETPRVNIDFINCIEFRRVYPAISGIDRQPGCV